MYVSKFGHNNNKETKVGVLLEVLKIYTFKYSLWYVKRIRYRLIKSEGDNFFIFEYQNKQKTGRISKTKKKMFN